MKDGTGAAQSRMAIMLFLAVAIIFTTFCTKPRKSDVTKLKFSFSMPSGHPLTTEAFEVWAERVGKVTSGRVEITLFPGDTLISAKTAFDAVKNGACDIAQLIQPYEQNRFPLTMVMNLPLSLPDATVSGLIAWDLFQKFPEIREEYRGVKMLFFYSTSAYEMHTPKKAIRKREDLQGALIRAGGPVDKAIAEALGGIPEFMHMPDTYLALSKGVLDAHMSPFGPMQGFRTADVTRYHTENADLHTSIFGIIMNLDKWKSLSLENQQAVEGVSGRAAAELFGRVFDRMDDETIRFMKSKGDIFIRLSEEEKSEWRKLLNEIVRDWVDEQESKGFPGEKILETAIHLKEKYSRLYP